MGMKEIDYADARPIDGYGPGFFRVGGVVWHGPVLVWPGGAAPWGGWEDAQAILLLRGALDIVLIGTGAEIRPIPAALRQTLESAGLGVEMMSSPSAARTYNVLLAEGRRMAAAMIPVGEAAGS